MRDDAKIERDLRKQFPHVFLTETDEKVLFDLSVKIKFGDLVTVRETCEELKTRLVDFPAQVFVQRPHVVEALGTLLSGGNDTWAREKGTLSLIFDCYLVLHRNLLLACYGDFLLGFEDLWLPDVTFPAAFLRRFDDSAGGVSAAGLGAGGATFKLPFAHFHRVLVPVLDACVKYAEAIPLAFRLFSWTLPMMA